METIFGKSLQFLIGINLPEPFTHMNIYVIIPIKIYIHIIIHMNMYMNIFVTIYMKVCRTNDMNI